MGRVKTARDACSKVVRAAIHPAIGIARVGNSETGFFIGPEVTDPEPVKPGFAKDTSGALKRQAARFRVFGYNAAGEAVVELTADNAEIEWTVQVANKKASWYQFQVALDIPEASSADPSNLRNASEADRSRLAITPKARSIAGAKKSGRKYWFDDGKFLDTPVYLGELRTDEKGRLIFLGGRGVSASAAGTPAKDFVAGVGAVADSQDDPLEARDPTSRGGWLGLERVCELHTWCCCRGCRAGGGGGGRGSGTGRAPGAARWHGRSRDQPCW